METLLETREFPSNIKLFKNKISLTIDDDDKISYIFMFVESGGSGKIYLNLKKTLIIKLLLGDGDEFKVHCSNEIKKQNEAANAGLAPGIVEHGFQLLKEDIWLCFMKMKYLTEHLDLDNKTVLKLHNDAICDFIHKLSDINLINITDPKRHFYLDNGQVKMIDYDFVQYIPPESDIIYFRKEMAKKCKK